jgi:CheY-like chemotaxis protein
MSQIVIVEDDAMLAEIYTTSVSSAGYTCYVANDGRTGLEMVKEFKPDLVLLDLMLPQLSGEEVLRGIRGDEEIKDTKVIILTNVSEYEAPEGLKELQFERYLVKANSSPNQVVEIVQQTLGGQPETAAAE